MAIVDYEYYTNIYGADIDTMTFGRLSWNAEKVLNDATTCVDGLCKLKAAFPTVPEDIEAVKRCVCEVVYLMQKIEQANTQAENGKIVSSVHAGNESISYAVGGGTIGAVLSDRKAQYALYNDTIRSYLSGVKDNNGVNMLYAGVYPYLVKY